MESAKQAKAEIDKPLINVDRVMTSNSPSFNAFYDHHPVVLTCDSGATSSLIRESFAILIQAPIVATEHTASQADGKSTLKTKGEVHITLHRGTKKFPLQAVVVEHLDCEVLVGMPFLKENDIVLDIPSDRIVIGGTLTIPYSPSRNAKLQANKTSSFLLRSDRKFVLLPGDYHEFSNPVGLPDDAVIAIEPRCDSSNPHWPHPTITKAIGGQIRMVNETGDPISVAKHQHIAQVRPTYVPSVKTPSHDEPSHHPTISKVSLPSSESSDRTSLISVDPDRELLTSERQAFTSLHHTYSSVFHESIGKYNDSLGKVRAHINMGPVEPPQHKGRIPFYNRDNLSLLQDKMDELENQGVLAKPEMLGVAVEHVSPSFLVKKPSGGHRLVTAFNSIGSYTKSTPSRVTTADEVLHFLAQWKYIIKTDMTSQFFQLPMTSESLKYLGVVTPFKGTRIYTRAAMGMPGSTEHLDELMSRVLGELIHEGIAMKIADDLYVGGDSIPDLLRHWERVLQRFQQTNLRLSPTKTVICPVTTTILGWIWSKGSISVSQHKVNPLTTCPPPSTVKGLRGWCGAVKHIKACIPHYSGLLGDFEKATAGKESRDRIHWSDSLLESFKRAQEVIRHPKTITIPRQDDHLIITSDGAVRNGGIGSVLYIMRNSKMMLGGYFSVRLKSHQANWLPCEIEALAISTAVNHWGFLILQSHHRTQVLTDSKPCVQAHHKLSRGEFSVSARVSTFLSTLSRYQIQLQHIAGSSNLPADYLSRSPMECVQKNCQVCNFVDETPTSVVRSVTVDDVINGKYPMPFTSKMTWKTAQQDCASLRRTYAHLSQGTRPGKKATRIRDVKRYLRVATLNREGIVVVKQDQPFALSREATVIPRHLLRGILTALHLQLGHPSSSQLQKVFNRYFYALDWEKEIKEMTSACADCAALKQLPKELPEFSTTPPSKAPGLVFACDVMCRARQKVLVVKDTFSSFLSAKIIANEQKESIRGGIIECIAGIKSPNGARVRVDAASAMQSLVADDSLARSGIQLEIGRTKNVNKNPEGERAIQELELELKKGHPDGGPISSVELALAVARLNNRIRNRGLSAKEILTQRDDMTGEKLNLNDASLSEELFDNRVKNHGPSARSKAPKGHKARDSFIARGQLVYLKSEGSKHSTRDRYIVTSTQPDFLLIQKLKGSQFRSKQYRVKPSEVYLVPSSFGPLTTRPGDPYASDSSSSDDEEIHQMDQTDADPAAAVDEGTGDAEPRQVRQRRRPRWMETGEWETG